MRDTFFKTGLLLTTTVLAACSPGHSTLPADDTRFVLVGADSPLIRYVGRTDRRDPAAPAFDWPASGLVFRFDGTVAGLVFEDSGDNDFSVFVDGKRTLRISARKGENRVVLADGLKPGIHTVEFIKSTEAYQGVTRIRGILLPPGVELLPVDARPLRIHVFGDSISAGYGTAATALDSGWHRNHADATRAWPFFLSRTTGAEITVTALSGRGIMRNWAEPGPRSEEPLPAAAWRILYSEPDRQVDTATEPAPDLVILCLGHNDMSPGYELTEEEFIASWNTFVDEIRGRWPGAPILCGSMVQQPLNGWLERYCRDKSSAGGAPVEFFVFSPIRADEFGCDSHPVEMAQKRFAADIAPAVSRLAGVKAGRL